MSQIMGTWKDGRKIPIEYTDFGLVDGEFYRSHLAAEMDGKVMNHDIDVDRRIIEKHGVARREHEAMAAIRAIGFIALDGIPL